MSILNIIQGDVDSNEIHKSLQRIKEKNLVSMIEWAPACIQVALGKRSKYLQNPHKVTGLMLANHTSIRQLFQKIMQNYRDMRGKNAWINTFLTQPVFNNSASEFDDSEEVVQMLIDEYRNAEKPNFID